MENKENRNEAEPKKIDRKISKQLEWYSIKDWTDEYGALFKAIKMASCWK